MTGGTEVLGELRAAGKWERGAGVRRAAATPVDLSTVAGNLAVMVAVAEGWTARSAPCGLEAAMIAAMHPPGGLPSIPVVIGAERHVAEAILRRASRQVAEWNLDSLHDLDWLPPSPFSFNLLGEVSWLTGGCWRALAAGPKRARQQIFGHALRIHRDGEPLFRLAEYEKGAR